MSTKIEVINQDLTTKEGWEEYLQSVLKEKADRAKHEELVMMETTLVITTNPLTDEPLPRPSAAMIGTIIGGATPEEADTEKERYAGICMSMAILGRAVASAVFSEGWSVVGAAAKQALRDDVRASQHPERQEVLTLMTAHRDFGVGHYLAVVTPKTKCRRKIGPWVNSLEGKSQQLVDVSGRFASFVPDPVKMEDPATRGFAKLLLSMHEDHMIVFKPKENQRAAQG